MQHTFQDIPFTWSPHIEMQLQTAAILGTAFGREGSAYKIITPNGALIVRGEDALALLDEGQKARTQHLESNTGEFERMVAEERAKRAEKAKPAGIMAALSSQATDDPSAVPSCTTGDVFEGE
ncbi:MAG: hypothetical protein AAGJ85_02675 [Pseudomonadota bacterium]